MNEKGVRLVGPDGDPLERGPRTRICEDWVPEQFRIDAVTQGSWYRCCSGQVRKLVDCCSTEHQARERGQGADGVLLPRPAGVLRHVLRHGASLLIEAVARRPRPRRRDLRRLVALRTVDDRDDHSRRVREPPPPACRPRALRPERDRRRRVRRRAPGQRSGLRWERARRSSRWRPLAGARRAFGSSASCACRCRSFGRRFPDWWRFRLPLPVWAVGYGAGLGVGFLTFQPFATFWIACAATVALGEPGRRGRLLRPLRRRPGAHGRLAPARRAGRAARGRAARRAQARARARERARPRGGSDRARAHGRSDRRGPADLPRAAETSSTRPCRTACSPTRSATS